MSETAITTTIEVREDEVDIVGHSGTNLVLTEVELEPDHLDTLSKDELWERFHQHNLVFSMLGRKTLEAAWWAGDLLMRIKAQLQHGEWLDELESHNIANQTANRYMRLRAGFLEIPQNGEFDTMQAALSFLKAKKGDEPAGNAPDPQFDDSEVDDQDMSWETMQKAVQQVRKGLDECSSDDQRGGLASILVGWLMEIQPVRTAMLLAADEWTVNQDAGAAL